MIKEKTIDELAIMLGIGVTTLRTYLCRPEYNKYLKRTRVGRTVKTVVTLDTQKYIQLKDFIKIRRRRHPVRYKEE